jgi:uncharacterized damage-inducible protein DinB
MAELDDYLSRGARALVLLHERQLPVFVATWRRAKAAGVPLPRTDDESYASLETLLRHVLAAARGYMTWICETLDLPDPRLPPVPELDAVAAQADEYLADLLAAWRIPLRDVPPDAFESNTYTSRWGEPFTIDSMLEHAVMHPIRHTFQLEELLRSE